MSVNAQSWGQTVLEPSGSAGSGKSWPDDFLPVSQTVAWEKPLETTDLDSVQREQILSTLRQSDWVVEGKQGAAVKLGLKPATLRHRMKKLGISQPTQSPA